MANFQGTAARADLPAAELPQVERRADERRAAAGVKSLPVQAGGWLLKVHSVYRPVLDAMDARVIDAPSLPSEQARPAL